LIRRDFFEWYPRQDPDRIKNLHAEFWIGNALVVGTPITPTVAGAAKSQAG